MGAENFLVTSVGGKRAAKRSRVLLVAKLRTSAGEIDCRLRDLSRKGALVDCAKQPPVGSPVTFIRADNEVPARVAWAAAGRVGLEFLHMIDEQDVLVQLKRRSGPRSFERFRRPGLNEPMTEDVRKLAEAWGVTVGLTVPGD